ncbi:MAG TPA: matrixin family metalloprotease [Gemmatimonadales bacterium]|nr:matrixin family metalloprotease [Gemmatimonadales bacterium]
MEQQQRTRLVGVTIALLVLAVMWSMVMRHRPARPQRASPPPVVDTTPARAPDPTRSQAGTRMPVVESAGPGYFDLLARAEIRRRIRASFPYTYLSPIVAASGDSMLHRWDDRVGRPVRVFLATDTVDGFQNTFLDAVRRAFERWQQAGVAVRFDVRADSADAEVRILWRSQFEIDRTGQTDLEWDREGHLRSGTVTIATHDPAGHPLAPDDVRVVALHEIGHLIGLDHSPDSTDVMFAKTVMRDLSDRDVRTAKLLYSLAPGSLR